MLKICLITSSLITSAEYNYQNTLCFFHFHVNIEFLKRMGRQLQEADLGGCVPDVPPFLNSCRGTFYLRFWFAQSMLS